MSGTDVSISEEELFKFIQDKKPILILDIRSKDSFMQGHIDGSANAKCGSMQQKQIVMSKLPRNFKIVLIDEDGSEAKENAIMMARFGFDAHYLEGGVKNWTKGLVKSKQETEISNESLWNSIKENSDVFLLDVREPQEYEEFKIPGAVNVPLSQLFMPGSQEKIPKGKKIVTVCSHGNRSMVATFALAQKGIESTSLVGGMAGWNQVLNPTVVTKNDALTVIQVEKIGKGCLSHIVGSKGEAIVIDPTYPASKYMDIAKEHSLQISKVIDTHQHADHVSAAKELSKIANAKLYFSGKEEYKIEHTPVNDGDKIQFGEKQLMVIHTPGHTAGSMTYLVDDRYVFSGDTLFVEGIGRPDLRDKADEFAKDLFETLHNKLLKLSNEVKIFPTHHGEDIVPTENGVYYTTVEQAKKLPLLDLGKDEFVTRVVGITTPRPMNYSMIIKVNKGAIPIMIEQVPDLEMGPNRCSIRTN